MFDFVVLDRGGIREWRGVAGIGGWFMADICVVDSLHILPVIPRRWDTHRSAWISQQPRHRAPNEQLRQVGFELVSGGWGGSASPTRRAIV